MATDFVNVVISFLFWAVIFSWRGGESISWILFWIVNLQEGSCSWLEWRNMPSIHYNYYCEKPKYFNKKQVFNAFIRWFFRWCKCISQKFHENHFTCFSLSRVDEFTSSEKAEIMAKGSPKWNRNSQTGLQSNWHMTAAQQSYVSLLHCSFISEGKNCSNTKSLLLCF